MGLFKKKKAIFGKNIEPQCQYCRYNMGEEQVECIHASSESACKKYEYDPLKREPKGTPKLRSYTPDDFSL